MRTAVNSQLGFPPPFFQFHSSPIPPFSSLFFATKNDTHPHSRQRILGHTQMCRVTPVLVFALKCMKGGDYNVVKMACGACL